MIHLWTKILPVSWSRFFQKTAAFCADALQKGISENSREVNDIYHCLAQGFIEVSYQRYESSSLKEKKFYNIGAGHQRSHYPYWTYIDLLSDSYQNNQPDIPFNLESLEKLPLPDDQAEIVYNSYLMEHISWAASKNLIHEAYRILRPGGGCFIAECTAVNMACFYTSILWSAINFFILESQLRN